MNKLDKKNVIAIKRIDDYSFEVINGSRSNMGVDLEQGFGQHETIEEVRLTRGIIHIPGLKIDFSNLTKLYQDQPEMAKDIENLKPGDSLVIGRRRYRNLSTEVSRNHITIKLDSYDDSNPMRGKVFSVYDGTRFPIYRKNKESGQISAISSSETCKKGEEILIGNCSPITLQTSSSVLEPKSLEKLTFSSKTPKSNQEQIELTTSCIERGLQLITQEKFREAIENFIDHNTANKIGLSTQIQVHRVSLDNKLSSDQAREIIKNLERSTYFDSRNSTLSLGEISFSGENLDSDSTNRRTINAINRISAIEYASQWIRISQAQKLTAISSIDLSRNAKRVYLKA